MHLEAGAGGRGEITCSDSIAGLLASSVRFVSCAAVAQSSLAGKWQGETGNGRQVVLDATVKGQQLSGTFTVAQQTVAIQDGKVADKTFTFKAAIDGRTPTLSGELVGEQIEADGRRSVEPRHAESREVGRSRRNMCGQRWRTRREARIGDELRSHRDRLIEDYIVAGMDRSEAERRAFLEFGNVASDRRRGPRRAGPLAGRFCEGPDIRPADASAKSRVLSRRHPVVRPRHRRQRRDIQPHQRRDAADAASARASAPSPDHAASERTPRPGILSGLRDLPRQHHVHLERLRAEVHHADGRDRRQRGDGRGRPRLRFLLHGPPDRRGRRAPARTR